MIKFSSIRRSTVSAVLAAAIILSLCCSTFAEIRLDATVFPDSDEPLQAVVTVNNIELGLLIPAENGTYYSLYWEDVPNILSQILGIDFSEITTNDLDDELLTSLALRYGKIIISVAGIFNFNRKKMNYELSAFHTAPQCVVWTCTPSRRDWSKMLTKLFSTALSDSELAALLPSYAEDVLRDGQNRIIELADFLDGVSFQAATDDNNIYAVKIAKNGESICYQYPGIPSCEHAVVYEKNGSSINLIHAVSELNSAALSETPHRVSSAEELTEILSLFYFYFQKIYSK